MWGCMSVIICVVIITRIGNCLSGNARICRCRNWRLIVLITVVRAWILWELFNHFGLLEHPISSVIICPLFAIIGILTCVTSAWLWLLIIRRLIFWTAIWNGYWLGCLLSIIRIISSPSCCIWILSFCFENKNKCK